MSTHFSREVVSPGAALDEPALTPVLPPRARRRWKSWFPSCTIGSRITALVWPSLSCRWGQILEQGDYKLKQRLYLSEQTDGSSPTFPTPLPSPTSRSSSAGCRGGAPHVQRGGALRLRQARQDHHPPGRGGARYESLASQALCHAHRRARALRLERGLPPYTARRDRSMADTEKEGATLLHAGPSAGGTRGERRVLRSPFCP